MLSGTLLDEEPMYALDFVGRRFDVGDKLGFLQATVELALGRSGSRRSVPRVSDRTYGARDVTYELRGGSSLRIVIAPDSFKGSLSAFEVARAIEKGVKRIVPDCETVLLPLSDGGEGLVGLWWKPQAVPTTSIRSRGPWDPVWAKLGLLGDGTTAVIEMAQASGLTLVPPRRRNPLVTTTYGTGELIRHALDLGCTHLVIGIGGSANDGVWEWLRLSGRGSWMRPEMSWDLEVPSWRALQRLTSRGWTRDLAGAELRWRAMWIIPLPDPLARPTSTVPRKGPLLKWSPSSMQLWGIMPV